MRQCLKYWGIFAVAVPISLMFAASAASAADVSAVPLKGVIRLGPGIARGVGSLRNPSVDIETLNKNFKQFSGNAYLYEYGAKKMPQVAKECSEKAYTVQDQKAAGCTGNESLNLCMEKLHKHCVQSYSVEGAYMPGKFLDAVTGTKGSSGQQLPGFSTKKFQQTSKTTAAEARALSKMFTQYANEVEQNAKALVPEAERRGR